MRRFELHRDSDPTGISGVGMVAAGVQWPDGQVALRWGQAMLSTVLYANVEDVISIHGHGGKTRLVWLDPPVGQSCIERPVSAPECYMGNCYRATCFGGTCSGGTSLL